MPPDRVAWCLDVIGWSRNEFARRLDVSDTTAAQFVTGKRNCPHRVAVWLETLASMMLALPEPFFWGDNADVGAERHVAGIEAAWDRPGVPAGRWAKGEL
jgi:transcriptional regulator with XRE-family HTH domain